LQAIAQIWVFVEITVPTTEPNKARLQQATQAMEADTSKQWNEIFQSSLFSSTGRNYTITAKTPKKSTTATTATTSNTITEITTEQSPSAIDKDNFDLPMIGAVGLAVLLCCFCCVLMGKASVWQYRKRKQRRSPESPIADCANDGQDDRGPDIIQNQALALVPVLQRQVCRSQCSQAIHRILQISR